MFYYTAFGFNIVSEMRFPELLERNNSLPADVRISIGATPETLEGGATQNPALWITEDKYLIHFKDVASYYAVNGNHITVDPCDNTEPNYIRLLLLCNAMAAIVHQRKLIPLHASGIIVDNGVVLFTGTAGAGKSTTITALRKKGHTIFTDDVCVLKSEDDKVFAISSYPMMKLWENSFEILQLDNKNEENRLRSDINKYAVYFHEQFNSKWQPVKKIFKIEKNDTAAEVSIKKLNGIEAFISVGENTYRSQYIEPMQLNAVHFKAVNNLLRQSEVYKITRPSTADTVSSVVDIIEKELNIK